MADSSTEANQQYLRMLQSIRAGATVPTPGNLQSQSVSQQTAMSDLRVLKKGASGDLRMVNDSAELLNAHRHRQNADRTLNE